MCLSKPKVEANAYILKGSWQDQACKCADEKKTMSHWKHGSTELHVLKGQYNS